MRNAPRMGLLWPGLAQLWRGDWRGLLPAVSFGAILDFALVTTFLWPDLVKPAIVTAAWVSVWGSWTLFHWVSHSPRWGFFREFDGPFDDKLFARAQAEYLKGNWHQTESMLKRLLRQRPSDIDGRLLLASLYRHTNRPDEAWEELRLLSQFAGAEKWKLEISREQEWLCREFENENSETQGRLTTATDSEKQGNSSAAA